MAKHTAGPWRWELNEKCRRLQLCGGICRYDLTVLDFERWGFSEAVMRLREPEPTNMNIMKRATEWARVVPGREHHSDWFKVIDHPDARLIAKAPELFDLCRDMMTEADDTAVDIDEWSPEWKAMHARYTEIMAFIKGDSSDAHATL